MEQKRASKTQAIVNSNVGNKLEKMEKELQFYSDLFMEQFPTMNASAKEYTRSILTLKKHHKKEVLYQSGEVQNEIDKAMKIKAEYHAYRQAGFEEKSKQKKNEK